MDKKKKPWKCRLFGCDCGPEGMRVTQLTDTVAVLWWTCKRCGERFEHLFSYSRSAADALERFHKQLENRNAEG